MDIDCNDCRSKCCSPIDDSIIPFKDEDGGDSTFYIVNRKREVIKRIKIDGCADLSADKKCDYLAIIPSINSSLWIELKGRDVRKAIQQISSSYGKFKDKAKSRNNLWAIVSSQCHIPSDEINDIKDTLYEKHKVVLHIGRDRLYFIAHENSFRREYNPNKRGR